MVDKSVIIPRPDLVNIYGEVDIAEGVMIGSFVEIQPNVKIGKNSRIQSHSFICEGVEIGENVFVGHGCFFSNDRSPVVNNTNYKLEKTIVEDDVSIGNGVKIRCGITLGKGCRIGLGAVITKNVPAGELWIGVPARKVE